MRLRIGDVRQRNDAHDRHAPGHHFPEVGKRRCFVKKRDSLTLDERRAIFVYEAARLENEAAGRPINPEPWGKRDDKFRANMIRAVKHQCGPRRSGSPEALHDAWVRAYRKMGWRYGPIRDPGRKEHPDMVPFCKLGRLEREKDWVYMKLCEIIAAMGRRQ